MKRRFGWVLAGLAVWAGCTAAGSGPPGGGNAGGGNASGGTASSSAGPSSASPSSTDASSSATSQPPSSSASSSRASASSAGSGTASTGSSSAASGPTSGGSGTASSSDTVGNPPSSGGSAGCTSPGTKTCGDACIPVTACCPAPDDCAPSAPTALHATDVEQTDLTLQWTESTDNVRVAAYRVLRDGADVALVPTALHVDTLLMPGTTHTYTVVAEDAQGNASAPSDALEVTTAPPDDLTSDLIGHWPLDEGTGTTTADASGQGHPGTLVGAPVWIPGNVGPHALSFAGMAGSVSLGVFPGVAGLTALTAALWVKPQESMPAAAETLLENFVNSAQVTLSLVRNRHLSTEFRVRAAGVSASVLGPPVADTRWHLLVGVYDGTRLVLYVDGVRSAATTPLTGATSGSTAALHIPTDSAAGQQSAVDDVRLYARALTRSEVIALYNLGQEDGIAPEPPTALTAVSVEDARVSLTWTPARDNRAVTAYRIHQDGMAVGETPNPPYTVEGLMAATPYTFTVSALDAVGNQSPPSPPLVVSTTGQAFANVASRVSGGVRFTWEFHCGGRPCAMGRFVNGEFWVAPVDDQGGRHPAVTLTRIAPDGEQHGAEANPDGASIQGLLHEYPDYRPFMNIMTRLPFAAVPGTSIFKVFRIQNTDPGTINGCREVKGCVGSDDVLTVLADIPANNGATVFRPPFHGHWKPLFTTDRVRGERLSSLGALGTSVDPGPIVSTWSVPVYQTRYNGTGGIYYRETSPLYVLSNYAAYQSGAYLGAVRQLLCNAPLGHKLPALYALVQQGVDVLAVFRMHRPFGSGAGQHMGKKPALTLLAAVYDDAELLEEVRSVARNPVYQDLNFFQEDVQVHWGVNGVALWGDDDGPPSAYNEQTYWQRYFSEWRSAVRGLPGSDNNGAQADPYGFIDGPPGGPSPSDTTGNGRNDARTNTGRNYQSVSAAYLVSHGFNQVLFPWYRHAAGGDATIHYLDRLQDHLPGVQAGGFWGRPDRCAPADPNESSDCNPGVSGCTHYGVTWGPDPARPGRCIEHSGDPDLVGRYVAFHGQPVGGGTLGGTSATVYAALRDCAEPGTPAYRSGPCAGLGPDPVPHAVALDGQCGTAHFRCAAGAPADAEDTDTEQRWRCEGLYGGNTVSCAVARVAPVHGSCGDAAGSYTSADTFPRGALCATGTPAPLLPLDPVVGGPVSEWTCHGGLGGNRVACTAVRFPGNALSPLAHWPLEEGSGTSVADVTLRGNNGVLSGTYAWVEGRSGAASRAVAFAGSNDGRLALGPVPAIKGVSAVTVSLWLRADDAENAADESVLENFGNSSNFTLSITRRAGARLGFSVRTSGGSLDVRAPPVTGTGWHHVAAVLEGSSGPTVALLYLDGVEAAQATLAGPSVTAGSSAGFMVPTDNGPRKNTVDDVRMWARALSAQEIAALFAEP